MSDDKRAPAPETDSATNAPTPAPLRAPPASLPGAVPSASHFTAFGLAAEAEPIAPGLHIVATPIGNLKDITFRALGTLAAADAVLAEDTRVTKVLLAHYGITTPLIGYHEHNAEQMRPKVLARLQAGEALALVSDAGTPLVSDPGYRLVEDALAHGIRVTSNPGPSAVLTALVVSGLPTDRFFFEGFLPVRSGPRRARLAALGEVPATLVFFESPRRVGDMLADAAAVLGERPAAVARELTKLYEEVRRDTLPALAQSYAQETPKGEIVVLVGPPGADARALSQADLDTRLAAALARHSVKDAAAIVSAETGQPKREVYARALQLTAARPDDDGEPPAP
ncbi:MAG: 16S rRNA (cytidine(1402)-2'-O)-methyltransferase [Pseudochelatococcus sp.]|uniref:16S rRNA (cytidine(1402)-2'-O)-methyltransferase n=1 Tax=Pseudochelatococcus sp. TaxID=2020869 RepID=UPI003D8B055A